MSLYILFATSFFLIVSFLSGESTGSLASPVLGFYDVQISFLKRNLIIFILGGSFGMIYLFFNSLRTQKSFLHQLKITVVATIVSSFFSLFIILTLAFLQLNMMSFLINASPKILGVESSPSKIIEQLKSSSSPPNIVIGSEEKNSVISAVALAQAGSESFYGNNIVRNIPAFLVINGGEINSSALLVADTLIIVRANSVDFQPISSVICYLFIKDFFPDQNIENYPKVSLMDQEDYQNYRQQDFDKKVKVLTEVIGSIDESMNDLAENVLVQEERLTSDQESLQELRRQREDQYIDCINEGYYEDGEYIKVNSKDECNEEVSNLEEQISELRKSVYNLEMTIEKNKEKLAQYEAYSKYYSAQKNLTDEMTEFISYEFASFEPPDDIRIAVFENNEQSVADYFELLVHEYLHYTTFDESGERLATDFFREGLTEYFARKIIKRNLGVDTNLGYPANVKIIEEISKRISDADLAEVYFLQDEDELEKLLDLVYDEGFYQRNRVTFETLHYSSNSQNILELGNSIIEEIGGEPLTKDDLKTTYSTFE
ncbi:hypothetical protein JXA63_03355 [Candidatus Woesebacteria bacterium]|nr:hypothetical protein [Candidatus Woesebacteria bacterium]